MVNDDRPVRALLIDPFKREIREVSDLFNRTGVLGQYLAQGERGPKRAPLCAGPVLAEGVFSYCDDEGYYRPGQAWARIRGYQHPIAGYCIVIGRSDGDEADCPAAVTPSLLSYYVVWTDAADAQATAGPITVTEYRPEGARVVEQRYPDFTDERPL